MTRREAERLLSWWAARLVPAWATEIQWDAVADGDTRAQVETSDHYEIATITVKAGWLEETDVEPSGDGDLEREVDLVHELLHVVGQPMQLTFASMARQLGAQASTVANDRYRHEDERQVERLARLLVGLRHGRGGAV